MLLISGTQGPSTAIKTGVTEEDSCSWQDDDDIASRRDALTLRFIRVHAGTLRFTSPSGDALLHPVLLVFRFCSAAVSGRARRRWIEGGKLQVA